ncbi:MAG: hypothetical protein ABIY55_02490 [Kofleriaceae bacterium]
MITMSELAFNVNGEPFEAPPTMAAWRVRKLKPKGAPEVVYGRDGLPLFLPMDADIEDLRREARGDGRYRLDPVDDHNRAVPNAQAAYVCVHPVERTPEPATPAPVAAVQVDSTAALVAALLESQKQHTELARMYVSQFPVIANAMAGVVRSAGDVGLTMRVPLIVPAVAEPKPDAGIRETEDEQTDDDDGDEIDEQNAAEWEEDEPAYSWPRVAQTFAEYVGPHVGPLLAGLPGLGAMLGAQPAKPKADVGPGPGPRDPAPAGAAPARTAARFDPSLAIRLRGIMAKLTPAEQVFAQSLLEEIPAEEMSDWTDRLRAMSVAEAVAYVRQMHDEARAAAAPANTAAQPRRATTSAPPTAATTPTAPGAVSVPGRGGQHAGSAREIRRGQPLASSVTRTTPTTAPSDRTPFFDPATQIHLAAIDLALTIEERAAMRKHFASLASSERAEWIGTLLMLPVAEAIATVRAQLDHDAASAPVSRSAGAADASATEPPPAKLRDSSSATRPATKPAAPRRASRNQPVATSRNTTSPIVTPDLAPTPATAAPEAQASTAPAIATAVAATRATAAEPSAIAAAELVSAAPSLPALTRTAHTHLADIESALAPQERLMVHRMIAGLSPEERDAWLHTLLSAPLTEGVAMLRDTIHALTSERHGVPLAIGAASVPVPFESGDQVDDDQQQDSDYDGDEDDDSQEDDSHEDDSHEDDSHEDDNHEGEDQVPDREAVLAVSDALPTLDAASLAHFQAIEGALTLAEKMRAHELASQRPAAELRAWYAELRAMSVAHAIARVRAELEPAHTDPAPRANKDGGVS